MFPHFSPLLSEWWGPFRLLGSYLVLIGFGTCAAGLTTWLGLPRLWDRLPRDRGKVVAHAGAVAAGKPTGAGLLIVCLVVPWLLVVMPWQAQQLGILGCLALCMLTGYLDDRSGKPWSEFRKGILDLVVALLACLALSRGQAVPVWWPLAKGTFELPLWGFLAVGTPVLWLCINTANCSDGVDGLAGGLIMLSLFYLGGFLYVVVGHVEVANYLLVPHNPQGAKWALLVFTMAGGLAGYLWHNAEPSAVLMGDAGSRSLGLLIGVAVLASGNPALVVVVAPVILINGGAGLVKLAVLRGLRRLGFDIQDPAAKAKPENGGGVAVAHYHVLRLLHSVRFPLHDHCRKNLKWSNTQVLVRFLLIQAFLTPFLLLLLVKLR